VSAVLFLCRPTVGFDPTAALFRPSPLCEPNRFFDKSAVSDPNPTGRFRRIAHFFFFPPKPSIGLFFCGFKATPPLRSVPSYHISSLFHYMEDSMDRGLPSSVGFFFRIFSWTGLRSFLHTTQRVLSSICTRPFAASFFFFTLEAASTPKAFTMPPHLYTISPGPRVFFPGALSTFAHFFCANPC